MNPKHKIVKYFVCLYFVLYLVIGLLCVDDYGAALDDPTQRQHSLVTYKYINDKIFNRNIYELQDIPDLEEYTHKYYGTAIQLPLVFVEDLTNFTMTVRQIYLMRHIYIFLLCFVGYIFFYFALRKIFKGNDLIPLIGLLLISLYPRYFSIQFVDIKNMVFAALNMITIYFMVLSVEKKSVLYWILFGAAAALATNSRMMAVIYPVIMIGYFLVSDITNAIEIKRGIISEQCKDNRIGKYLFVIISYCVFWILISPFAWSNPVEAFVGSFIKFSHYDAWNYTMVFMGRLITCEEMPWYYLFVWFGISIPIIYLILFMVGHVHLAMDIWKAGKPWQQLIVEDKWAACSLLLFWGSVGAVILLHSRIYVGWHHMYYVFVPFCIVACFGFKELMNRLGIRIVTAVVGVSLIAQCAWMIYYHPSEPSYFNIIGKPFGDQFDREEWRTSSYSAVKWILENEEGTFSLSVPRVGTATYLLTEEEKSRIISEEVPKYIVNCYNSVIGNEVIYEGYSEVYTIWVDKYKVCSVFRRIEADII